MKTVKTEEIEKKIYEMALAAGRRVTDSCMSALHRAEAEESSPAARFALGTILENADISAKTGMPLCQDTGMAVVLMRIGQDVRLDGKPLRAAVDSGVRRAYRDGYFRMSVCDPITRENTGDNTPAYLHTEICEGDGVEITFLPKGFGSENMSRLYMLTPSQGEEGILKCITDTVLEAGSRPCPPVYVGVGIGSTFDGCAHLAKIALCRDVGRHSDRNDIARIEEEALRRVNGLGIGSQGFGGDVTAIGVSCEWAPTHIAGLPVAVNIQCHCVRRERCSL